MGLEQQLVLRKLPTRLEQLPLGHHPPSLDEGSLQVEKICEFVMIVRVRHFMFGCGKYVYANYKFN